jgi:hypothetical protein
LLGIIFFTFLFFLKLKIKTYPKTVGTVFKTVIFSTLYA